MAFFGLFEHTRTEVEAQELVETRWRNAKLMLNGDSVTKAQEVLFKLILGEVVEEQIRNQRQLKIIAWLVAFAVGEGAIGILLRVIG